MNQRRMFSLVAVAWLIAGSQASGQNAIPRILPPPGIVIPDKDLAPLREKLAALTARIQKFTHRNGERRSYEEDVEVFLKAVRFAIENGEFFDFKDVAKAHDLLKEAEKRLVEVERDPKGKMPRSWANARGLVVRGFRSVLDSSLQPYGVHVPAELDLTKPNPVYVWLHGRGDKMTDLQFIHDRMTKPGPVAPKDGIMVHPFGRYCNGFKFAGETDVWEVRAQAIGQYSMYGKSADGRSQALGAGLTGKRFPQPMVLWGFSMGGAGAWHLGAHYHDNAWAVVSPGAGFAETAKYQKLDASSVPSYEHKLWGLYDAPDYVRNLFNVKVFAYSGELDKQMQAALVMADAYKAEGKELTHLIGPGVEHKYEPKTLEELSRRISEAAKAERDRYPKTVRIQTKTLAYNKHAWATLEGLQRHWEDSRLDGEWVAPERIVVTTKNVTSLELESRFLREALNANQTGKPLAVEVDGTRFDDLRFAVEKGWGFRVKRDNAHDAWRLVDKFDPKRKRSGLQGPIDDAFMGTFRQLVVVRPTGKSANPKFDAWCKAELDHFLDRWKRLFRGEPIVRSDADDIDEVELSGRTLVLWGDRDSNKLIARIADKLPLHWDREAITVGDKKYASAGHALSLIAPNPYAEGKNETYVVLNSGITFREGHDKSNSLQTPKLPDWAVIDLSPPPDAFTPGKIVNAGFFNEQWQYQPGW